MVYTSTDFDGQRSTDYTLLIKVGQTKDVLAIVDDEAQLKLLTIVDPQQQLTDLLDLDYGGIKIAAPDQGYAFIPAEVFDAANLPVYCRYLPDEGLADPLVSSIDSLGIKIVCQLNRFRLTPYLTKFPHAVIHPAVQSFLCGVRMHAQAGEPVLAVDKAGATARISFFDSGKFYYCNDFEVHGAADLNYHLLTVMEHINLTDKKPQLFLSGDIDVGDAYYQCAAKYAQKVALADTERLTGISVPSDLKQDKHRFLSLFGLHLCG